VGEPRPELGVIAAPEELIDALHALGAIRAPSRAERARIERQSASRELLRLECAHHLAGVVEMQVLMAAGAAADAIEEPAAEDSTRVLMAGWELFSGASADQDDARVARGARGPAERRDHADGREVAAGRGRRAALAARDAGAGARRRTRDAAARVRRGGGGDDPRRELAQVVEQMRSTAEILESTIPPEHRSTDKGAGRSTDIT
jgi:hypothetical protein